MTPVPPVSGEPDPSAVAAALRTGLLSRRATIATAESLTGGGVGELLTRVPGASDVYLGGVVSYATAVKRGLLRVSARTISEHGVVSAECAAEMATGARALLGADYSVSTTGVAGPSAQEGKPVGTVFIGVAGPDGCSVHRAVLEAGDRARIRERACLEALSAALAVVEQAAR